MPADLKSILRLEVPLSVQIATRPMRVREISALSPGAIIELPKLADEQLDVTIGGRRIGSGTAVKVGENFGVRITQVGSMRQRIAALGPQADTSRLAGSADETDSSPSVEVSPPVQDDPSAAVGNSPDAVAEESPAGATDDEAEQNHSEP